MKKKWKIAAAGLIILLLFLIFGPAFIQEIMNW